MDKVNVNVGVAMTPAFHDWMMRLADHVRLSKSNLIENGLLILADAFEFPEEPPKRKGKQRRAVVTNTAEFPHRRHDD